MHKGTQEYPHTTEFIRYATSTCGMPAELHGKQEAMKPGAELMLALPQPYAASAFSRARIPPIVVRVASLCIVGENEDTAEAKSQSADRVFEGETVMSLHHAIKEGDKVIGLASPGCDVLVVNAENPEDMEHLLTTYSDDSCMQHVEL